MAYFLLAAAIIITSSSQLLLKKGMNAMGPVEISVPRFVRLILDVFTNFHLLGGLALMGVSFLLWLILLSRFKLGILYPISTSAVLVFVTSGAVFLFRESFTWLQGAGTILILFGIILLTR